MRERPLPGPPLCFFLFFLWKEGLDSGAGNIKWKDEWVEVTPSRRRVEAFPFLPLFLFRRRLLCVLCAICVCECPLHYIIIDCCCCGCCILREERTNKRKQFMRRCLLVMLFVVHINNHEPYGNANRYSLTHFVLFLGPPFYPLSLIASEKRLRSVGTNARS